MKNTATVKFDAAYFDTAEGEAFFDKYTEWKNGNSISEDIKRRREKLAAAGNVTGGGSKLDDVSGYIKRVMQDADGSLTLTQLTDAINELVKAEGKTERANNSGVSLSARQHCKAFVTVEGKGKDAKYTYKPDEEEQQTAELATATGKGKATAKGGKK